jgi:hypothetical protein
VQIFPPITCGKKGGKVSITFTPDESLTVRFSELVTLEVGLIRLEIWIYMTVPLVIIEAFI